MANFGLRALLTNADDANNNDAMVDDLQRSGALRTAACIAAFRAVDRGHFWVAGSGNIAYADMPLRSGRLHQSAPHIYARALEALMPLRAGMSFLNVGSGTGYFSSLVAELLGEGSVNDGIDIWPELVEHSRERCRRLGKGSIEFNQGNIYQLDVNVGMRYDRIYIGACASERAKYLYELLEVGGILVAPFEAGHSQQLRKVERVSEKHFKEEMLNAVHFATLVVPPRKEPAEARADGEAAEDAADGDRVGAAPVVGLPGVPFTFALRQQPWSMERSWAYPEAYRRVVASVAAGHAANPHVLCLPVELWVKHILPWCPRWWFEPPLPPPPPSVPARALSALVSAGAVVKRALLQRGGRSLSSTDTAFGEERISVVDSESTHSGSIGDLSHVPSSPESQADNFGSEVPPMPSTWSAPPPLPLGHAARRSYRGAAGDTEAAGGDGPEESIGLLAALLSDSERLDGRRRARRETGGGGDGAGAAATRAAGQAVVLPGSAALLGDARTYAGSCSACSRRACA
eukprot:CAMPEP_0170240432 /NCGR_PEP_ID=MMETSP0116_2-20130129/19974_1 /TAXON_ID=400756 /ORGANISM="Durinskia baltica, Strain CSIRO CS-38" /LENGTH=517 /DNA_ID=CAMNT_0010491251 /DNA_START=119 /DNA_END=1670 /DNA_ORIENTATION=+